MIVPTSLGPSIGKVLAKGQVLQSAWLLLGTAHPWYSRESVDLVSETLCLSPNWATC